MKEWLDQFWWLRGFAAALSLVGLVTTYVDTSNYELLLAFNVVALSWNIVADHLGELIGFLPIIPHLSDATVNAIIVFFALFLPGVVAFIKGDKKEIKFRLIIVFAVFSAVIFLGLDLSALIYQSVHEDRALPPILNNSLTIYLWLVLVTVLALAMTMPKYRRAVVFVISFIIGLQFVFFASAPWTADFIKELPCRLSGEGSHYCDAETALLSGSAFFQLANFHYRLP